MWVFKKIRTGIFVYLWAFKELLCTCIPWTLRLPRTHQIIGFVLNEVAIIDYSMLLIRRWLSLCQRHSIIPLKATWSHNIIGNLTRAKVLFFGAFSARRALWACCLVRKQLDTEPLTRTDIVVGIFGAKINIPKGHQSLPIVQ